MHHPYKTREGGCTVTVFVPYDCNNNCPFCINKGEYADTTGFSLDKICENIKLMDEITPNCDFVFTGGEPFADLESLQRMLDLIPDTHNIYINTTLPVSENQPEEEILRFAEKNKDKIDCINVSRHVQRYVVESNDDLLAKLPIPFRINCVLYEDYPFEELIPFIERFRKIPGANIQFRFDYTATTPKNLYDRENDRIIRDLDKIARYTGMDGCRMRCGFHYDYKGMEIVYHKTLPYSAIIEEDPADGVTYCILYDIMIKQNGDIHADWGHDVLDELELDIEAYRNVKFEPYDMRWYEIVEPELSAASDK